MKMAHARHIYLTGAPRRIGAPHQRGAIGILGAITLLLSFAFLALAVDTGRLWLERRNLQKMADLAAMAAVRYTGCGGSADLIRSKALETVRNNGLASALADGSASITTTYGTLSADPQKVTIYTPSNSASTLGTYATRVSLTRQIPTSIVLGGMFTQSLTITAAATAKGGPPIATYAQDASTFSITPMSDSFNALWNKIYKGNSPVSASQLQTLLGSSISVKSLMVAANVNSVDELLASKMTISELISTYSTAVQNGNADPDVLTALSLLANAAGKNGTALQLGDILKLNNGGDTDSLVNANINLFSLVNASVKLFGKSTFAFDSSFDVLGSGVQFKAIDVPPIAIGPGGLINYPPILDKHGNIPPDQWCTHAESTSGMISVFVSPTTSPAFKTLVTLLKAVTLGLLSIDLDLAVQLRFGNASTNLDYIEPNSGKAKAHFLSDTSAVSVKYTNRAGDADGQMIIKIVVPFGLRIGNAAAIPVYAPKDLEVNTPIHDPGNLPAQTTATSETAGTLAAIIKSAPPKITPIFGNSSILGSDNIINNITDTITTAVVEIITPILSTAVDPFLRALGINLSAAQITLYEMQNVQPKLVQ